MRCKYCNGAIIYVPAHGHYSERWHCFNCGWDIEEERSSSVKERSSSIEENLEEVDKPRKRRYTKRKDYW